ncbi:DUF2515 family protein [Evansella tamaricis]|uniref:DUF2515 domain-containing protein n=1 Tax=Evansella tamaricis TaxID=2069301 RepID=A0ABS6JKJ0_9BACI|nr:DUF2515 family protein [Evansella tamaricis]MBU9714063.1 DUF2515 domain-containing protein [Evansella tamaricis]
MGIFRRSTLLEHIAQIPNKMIPYVKKKLETLGIEKSTEKSWSDLSIDQELLDKLKESMDDINKYTNPIVILPNEKKIVQEIKTSVRKENVNNLTRTSAYLKVFNKYPEVHWALLAHFVSRNGGWNMTDLKGSILSGFLSERAQKSYFTFLERANAAIFHDAYPQLLLYEASRRDKKSYSHLLPVFGVSKFMIPIWEEFIRSKNSKLLTVALIINEQHYIEERIVQNHIFQENVFNTWQYQVQEAFHLVHVLFPYATKSSIRRIAGHKVVNFRNVEERVNIGKQLYLILFGIPVIYKECYFFAKENPHTGSREDYWPHMFSKGEQIKEEWHSCWDKGKPFMYSPTLTHAWENIDNPEPIKGDWYLNKGKEIFKLFESNSMPGSFDVTNEYCKDLYEMNMIAAVKNTLD